MPDRRRVRDLVAASIVASLLAFGGRFSRRAALRGVFSAILAGFAAGLVGSDPSRDARRAARVAALATGIGIESPTSGRAAAAGGGAAALAADRPSRLGAAALGTAIGSATALATLRWWPVAPRDAAQARRPGGSELVPVDPDGAGLAIIVNADAGPALSGNPADPLRDALPGASVIELAEGDDAVELAGKAAPTARVLGACGGDGTLNAVAGVALDAGLPFFAVPGGTLNHFARDAGLTTVDDAVDALCSGRLAEIDVGMIADRPFLNTASFGAYPELVDARERLESRVGKWPALAWSLVDVLRHATPFPVDLDGVRHDVWMVFVGNCVYQPPGFAPTWRDRLDDGLLDIRLVDAHHPFARTRLVLAVLTGTLARTRVYEQRLVRELGVRARDGAVRLASDGETFDGPERFTIEKAPQRLRLVVPAADEDADRVP